MILVPEPNLVTGVELGKYDGLVVPSHRIFTQAVLQLDGETSKWRRMFTCALEEDEVEVVNSPTKKNQGPGGLCVEIKMCCDVLISKNEEHYVMDLMQDNIVRIVGATPKGCFWAIQTLRQILRQTRSTFEDVLHIEDQPCFPVRGVMLDVSRDRIPTMEKLKESIALLSSVKINHIQLYMEHTFAYQKHQEVWRHASPFTAAEIRELDQFCWSHCITLVPCQNTLGHMHRWLSHNSYRHLAEIPDGLVHPFAKAKEPFSLCPSDPEAFELVKGLLHELVPLFETNLNSETPLVNINLDEAFDLGRKGGRTHQSPSKVLAEWAEKVNCEVKHLGARSMMWADGVNKKNISKISNDITLVEWGYEKGHKWKKRLTTLATKGHSVFVAPGTSSWSSIGGRTENAVGNLLEAAYFGKKHGASGYLIADWGDYGHHQQSCISNIGFLIGSMSAWHVPSSLDEPPTELEITARCDLVGFFSSEQLASAAYRLGNVYNLLPRLPNMSLLWLVLAIPEPIHENHLIEFAFENFTVIPYPRRLLRLFGPLVNILFRTFLVHKRQLFVVKTELEQIIRVCLGGADTLDSGFQQLKFTASLLDFLADIWILRLHKGIHRPAVRCSFDLETYASLSRDYKGLWNLDSRVGGQSDSLNKLNYMVALEEKKATEMGSVTSELRNE